MSDTSQGEGWWAASDNKWYPPEQHPDYVSPAVATQSYGGETIAVPAASANPGPDFQAPGAATQTYAPGAMAEPNFDPPAAGNSSSSKRGLILGVGALILIAGIGFLGFRLLGGASAAGGASSPEAAIDQLIASVNERDAVGFVDVFDPDEIDAWFGSFAPALSDFDEIGADGEATNEITDAYGSVFDSFDYALTGPGGEAVTYEVDALDDDGRISRVRVQGLDFELMLGNTDTSVILGFDDDPVGIDLTQIDGTRLELRDERSGLAARLLVPGEPAEDEFSPDAHLDLVTVQKDGKWFVSIGYSFLEIARNQGEFDDFPRPDFGRGFALVDDQTGGAESPEQVVQSMFTAIESLDYESIIEITDPYATPYLHDYQPLIDSQVNEADRQDAVQEANLRFDDLELSTSEWEGRTLVTTTDISGTGPDVTFNIDTTAWCVTIEDEFDRERLCLEDGIAELLFEIDSDLDPRDFIPDQTGFIVVERNGRWYIDALGTMGFYADQIAEIASTLTDDFEGNAASEFGDIFLVEGPIARQDMPAATQAESGSAGVAVDLSGYPMINGDFSDFHVAVARVVTDQPGNFVSFDDVPLTGEDWVVVYEATDGGDFETPAIAIMTDGSLDVELFEVQMTEVGLDGFSGQLGGQGRPQVFTFTDDTSDADITIDGASAETVSRFDANGVVLNRTDRGSFIGNGPFTVIYGEPGASFTINVDVFEPEPEPTPPPTTPVPGPTPGPFSDPGDLAADAFAQFVDPANYEFSSNYAGGFFDNCNGPTNPDATSYEFIGLDGDLIVLTVYPDSGRAQDAFASMANVSTPCAGFIDIEVIQVTQVDGANTLIEWVFLDDPTSSNYEHYRVSGDTIVVATGMTLPAINAQLEILDGW